MISSQDSWPSAPEHVVVADGDVHVWLADLNQQHELVMEFRNKLAQDERNRADRFYSEKDRVNFTVARGVLREILSYYLDTPPENIEFSYGPFGKPALKDRAETTRLCFNISHSYGMALYAIACNREIGVDLELISEDAGVSDIADRSFSPKEILALRGLPRELQQAAFFNCWARKEAYIKARGGGLPKGMDHFTASFLPGKALLSSEDDLSDIANWFVTQLPDIIGYASALAGERPIPKLTFWKWNPNLMEKAKSATAFFVCQ